MGKNRGMTSKERKVAYAVKCPECDAGVRMWCRRSDNGRMHQPHKTRLAAATARLAEWKAAAQSHADSVELVAGDSLFDEGDSYDLAKAAIDAFDKGEDPKAFVERMFEEDIASREHDAQMAAEALEHGEFEGEYELE